MFDGVYDRFRTMLVGGDRRPEGRDERYRRLRPVINHEQMTNMLSAVERAKAAGATVLTGGHRLTGSGYGDGYCGADDPRARRTERRDFAQRAVRSDHVHLPREELRRGDRFRQRLAVRPDGASIHTQNIHRAMTFLGRIQAGVAVVNGGTYGSEPHMPFACGSPATAGAKPARRRST